MPKWSNWPKWIKCTLWIFLYLAVWFGFGVAYRSDAQWSHGEDFSFSGDLKTEALISAFREKADSKADHGIIKALVDNKEYSKLCLPVTLEPSTNAARSPDEKPPQYLVS
jgi:hypothetical protein